VKVAIVHDWLVTYAGAERVLEQIIRCYPQAELFSVVDFIPSGQREFLQKKSVQSTFIQKLPFARVKYRQMLPLMPRAIGRWKLSKYDLILSSSHAVAKGVKTHSDQLHISYIHTPMRYAWDLREQYLHEANLTGPIKGFLANKLLDRMRAWDAENTKGVQHLIANSNYIAERIQNNYRRDSRVIYPPVKVDDFPLEENKENFYLTASRFVPYKKIDLIVETFASMPDKKLVVIGDGPDNQKIRSKAASNVLFMGYQPFPVLREKMQKAKAFVFAAEEDFGIAVVEAQACGTPVIVFGRGGALETVRGLEAPEPTGVFFQEQSVETLRSAIQEFEAKDHKISPQACRENALRFNPERFRKEYTDFVEEKYAEFYSSGKKLSNPPIWNPPASSARK